MSREERDEGSSYKCNTSDSAAGARQRWPLGRATNVLYVDRVAAIQAVDEAREIDTEREPCVGDKVTLYERDCNITS